MRNGIGNGSAKMLPVPTKGRNMIQKLLARFGYVKEADVCADCREIRYFKAKRLDDLEEAVRNLPPSAPFASAFVVEEKGVIRVQLTTNKARFLALIKDARAGKINLVF